MSYMRLAARSQAAGFTPAAAAHRTNRARQRMGADGI